MYLSWAVFLIFMRRSGTFSCLAKIPLFYFGMTHDAAFDYDPPEPVLLRNFPKMNTPSYVTPDWNWYLSGTTVLLVQKVPTNKQPNKGIPYVWLPKPENYWKIAKTVLNKAPEVSKLRLSNFQNCTPDYLKYACSAFLFRSDNYCLRYWSSTNRHDLEASVVVFGHSTKFIDRRYAVYNSVDRITIYAELSFEMLRSLSTKTKSITTDQSVISNRMRILKFNDNR